MSETPAAQADNVRPVNLHHDSKPGAPAWRKIVNVLGQYASLVRYAATTDSKLFHILWFYKVEWFDNTVLILYYKLLGKRLALTVHNVNRKARDGSDSAFNRWSLRFLYRHVDHIFVHSAQMKAELKESFGVGDDKVTAIPFGVNSYVFQTALTRDAARRRLNLAPTDRVLLFFGNIAPYKGVDTLVDALTRLPDCRLIIAGSAKKGVDDYWHQIESAIAEKGLGGRVLKAIRIIPEEEVEIYFKSADVVVLPYKTISQSGVLFLSYGFGVPVVASNVGGLAEGVKEGVTGFVCRPDDPADLAKTIAHFFESELFKGQDESRKAIVRHLHDNHSWDAIASETMQVYAGLLPERRYHGGHGVIPGVTDK